MLNGESKEGLEWKLNNSILKAFEKPVLEIIGDDEGLVEVKGLIPLRCCRRGITCVSVPFSLK